MPVFKVSTKQVTWRSYMVEAPDLLGAENAVDEAIEAHGYPKGFECLETREYEEELVI